MEIRELFYRSISDTDNILKQDMALWLSRLDLSSYMEIKNRPLRDMISITAWSTDSSGRRSFLMGRALWDRYYCREMHFEDGELCELHSHSHIELLYVVEGWLKIRIEGKDVIVREGEQLLINAGVTHGEFLHRENSLLLCLGLEDTYFAGESDMHSALSGLIARKKSDYMFMRFSPLGGASQTKEAYGIILSEVCGNRPGKKHIMIGYGERIVDLLHEEFQVQVTKELKEDFQQALVEDITVYVEENYADLSVKSIGEEYHYSPDYLNRIFRKIEGMTLSTYIQEVRLQEAAKLLRTTDLTVEEIALKVGYHNLGFFYQLYKKRYGRMPSWERRNRHM